MAPFTSESLPEFEVEVKFGLDDTKKIEANLTKLGFQRKTEVALKMVDWYWEDSTSHNAWTLTKMDAWLRLRQIFENDTLLRKSSWQLKLRKKADASAVTAYEEMVGDEAIDKAIALLPRSNSQKRTDDDQLFILFQQESQHTIPAKFYSSHNEFPLLLPFVRMETKRSSWICNHEKYQNIKVDFDTATYHPNDDMKYAVGEVEIVVHSEEEIAKARKQVEQFVQMLTGTNNASPVIGKLEYYLKYERPKHYQALVDCGTL